MKGQVLKLFSGQRSDDLAAAVAAVNAEKTKAAHACVEIERLEQERRRAVDFDAARVVDDQIGRFRWQIEHANEVLPELERHLALVLAEHNREALARHQAILRRRFPKFRAALQAAVEQQAEVVREREEAAKELGEHVVAIHLPLIKYAGFLYRDLFAIWAGEQDRVFAEPLPQVAPRPAPAPAPAEPQQGFGWSRLPEPVAAPEPPPRPKRQPRRDAEAGKGQQLVRILRNSVDIGGFLASNGDIVAVDEKVAEALVKGGAADFTEPTPGAAA